MEVEEFIKMLDDDRQNRSREISSLEKIIYELKILPPEDQQKKEYAAMCSTVIIYHSTTLTGDDLFALRSFILEAELTCPELLNQAAEPLFANKSLDQKIPLLAIMDDQGYIFSKEFLLAQEDVKEKNPDFWLDLMMPIDWKLGLANLDDFLSRGRHIGLISLSLVEWGKYCPQASLVDCLQKNIDKMSDKTKESALKCLSSLKQ